MLERVLFLIVLCFIGTVSAFDLSLAVKYRAILSQVELNPQIIWIMKEYGIEGLVFFKFTGTILVICILSFLFDFYRKLAYLCAFGTSLFQMCLLIWILKLLFE